MSTTYEPLASTSQPSQFDSSWWNVRKSFLTDFLACGGCICQDEYVVLVDLLHTQSVLFFKLGFTL